MLLDIIGAIFGSKRTRHLTAQELDFCLKTRFLDVFLAAKTTDLLTVLKQAKAAGVPLQISLNGRITYQGTLTQASHTTLLGK